MAYCSNCGEKIPAEALFCPKCGAKTTKDVEKTVVSSEELRATFNKIEKEFEKAFAIASKEIQAAIKTAREKVQQSSSKEDVACSSCGEKNPSNAVFCYNCGAKIESETKKKE